MIGSKPDVATLVNRMPDADNPGKPSKFTGPTREAAKSVVAQILAEGRESLLELIGMIRDANGFGEENYKPGYVLHCIATHVGRPGNDEQRRLFAETLASRLGSSGAPKGIQGYLVRELQVAGGRDVTETLGKLLPDDELCEYAAQALVAIGDAGAAQLRSALPTAKGKNRVTVVQALGAVRDAGSVAALKKVLEEEDRDVRMAAAWSLARGADPGGAEAVVRAADRAEGWERIQITKACLLLAENLLKRGKRGPGVKILEHLRDTREDPADRYIREAAKRALKSRWT